MDTIDAFMRWFTLIAALLMALTGIIAVCGKFYFQRFGFKDDTEPMFRELAVRGLLGSIILLLTGLFTGVL
jgi:hypothetical protein